MKLAMLQGNLINNNEEQIAYTVQQMYRLADQYRGDVDNYNLNNVYDIFRFTQDIPYVRDIDSTGHLEALKRPSIGVQEGDCDDKTIFAAAALSKINIPYRIVTTSYRPDKEMQHAYLEILLNGRWLPFDATFKSNKIFTERPFTHKIIWIEKMKTNLGSDPANGVDEKEKGVDEKEKKEKLIAASITKIAKALSFLKGWFGGKVRTYMPWDTAHAESKKIEAEIRSLYSELDNNGRKMMSEKSNQFYASVLNIVSNKGNNNYKAYELIMEQEKAGRTYGWWNIELDRVAFQCTYPIEAVLLGAISEWVPKMLQDWIMNPLDSMVLKPLRDYKVSPDNKPGADKGSGIIPGVDNSLLLIGAAGLALIMFAGKGKR